MLTVSTPMTVFLVVRRIETNLSLSELSKLILYQLIGMGGLS